MMDRCPNCKARYRQGDTCHRCGMDLSWLLKIKKNVKHIQQQVVIALRNKQYEQAGKLVKRHRQLIHDPWFELLAGFLEKRCQKADQESVHGD